MKTLIPILALTSSSLIAQTPVVSYNFNSTGVAGTVTSTPSSGSDTTAVGLFENAVIATTGPSGLVGDSSLSTRATNAHGTFSTVNPAISGRQIDSSGLAIDNDALDEFQSFTLMGWYNVQQPVAFSGAPRIMANSNTSVGAAGGAGFSLRSNGGDFTLEVDGANVLSSTTAPSGVAFDVANTWVFIAVTYDGTQTANNVMFYGGDTDTPVTATFSTRTLNQGTVDAETGPLIIGNRAALNRPLDAFFDNIRIFGSKTDASGALTAAQIESFRAMDGPPPSSPIAGWRQMNFGTTANTGNAANTFDADFDGLTNLVEYAFDLNPNQTSVSPVLMQSPTGGYFKISFPRYTDRTDITYNVRASGNLVNWTTIASSTAGAPIVASGAQSATETGDGIMKTVTVEDAVLINSTSPRFLRVEIVE